MRLVVGLLFCALTACGGGGGSSAVLPPAAADPSPVTPVVLISEEKTITQTIDGQLVDRPYLIRRPEKLLEDNYPVVFFFHGSGGTGEGWLSNNTDVSRLIKFFTKDLVFNNPSSTKCISKRTAFLFHQKYKKELRINPLSRIQQFYLLIIVFLLQKKVRTFWIHFE